jgi:acetyltransferase-like isoleucine patch superfamily enzyme
LPEYSRFTAISQLLSLIPGFSGVFLRRVWYRNTLKRCGEKLIVDWLAVIRTSDTEVGDHCTLGVANWVGWAKLENDVMTGSHVVLLSGKAQHGFGDMEIPMRLQRGSKRQLHLGDNVWIGAHAVIMQDVSSGTVIGAGSVVTKTFPPNLIIAGNPAVILKPRNPKQLKKDTPCT